MKIVLLSHPSFLGHQSMPRYTDMLYAGMTKRGHDVEVVAPPPTLTKRFRVSSLRKWIGYIDQYLLFPRILRSKLVHYPAKTLFVVTDHALGPWVPVVSNRPHVIHCHDFLAQRSARGHIAENVTGYTGRLYQSYIREGYTKGKNFISVSENTRFDLHDFLGRTPAISEVVYNGVDARYHPANRLEARSFMESKLHVDAGQGYFLHIGGNQWYKNRRGVIRIYNAWRKISTQTLPLLLIGEVPDDDIRSEKENSPYSDSIHFLTDADDRMIRFAYSGATAFLFPSLGEGFGWPIAEAMACGCVVVTTKEPPMTEVGGTAARYIPRMPSDVPLREDWAKRVALSLEEIVLLAESERQQIIEAGYRNAARFDLDRALDKIEEVYERVCLTN